MKKLIFAAPLFALLCGCPSLKPQVVNYTLALSAGSDPCFVPSKGDSAEVTLSASGKQMTKTFSKSDLGSGSLTATFNDVPDGPFTVSAKVFDASGSVIGLGPTQSDTAKLGGTSGFGGGILSCP